jgi:hypothetical protein
VVVHSELIKRLEKWMLTEHARFHRLKRVPVQQQNLIHARAKELVDSGTQNGTLRVLEQHGVPLAIMNLAPSRNPRVAKQQHLFFIYDSRSRRKLQGWLKKNLREVAERSPRHTQVGMSESDDKFLKRTLEKSGFNTRYEVLVGETKIALANLKRKKSPRRDLAHLGLELRGINSPSQIRDAMVLQKRVSLESKRHGYFSHTPSQLKKDREEYNRIVTGKMDGKILGVYRGKKILGLMVAGVHAEASASERNGGFSFFLDPSIQRQGITKTGYLLLLEYLVQKKIHKFYGGTSQPAIQSLGKIMKRQVQHVIYVKMGR